MSTIYNPNDHKLTWNDMDLMQGVQLGTFASNDRVSQEITEQAFDLQGRGLAIAGTVFGGSFTVTYQQHAEIIKELIAIAVADRDKAPQDRTVGTLEVIDRAIGMRRPYLKARLATIPPYEGSSAAISAAFIWLFERVTPEILPEGT